MVAAKDIAELKVLVHSTSNQIQKMTNTMSSMVERIAELQKRM